MKADVIIYGLGRYFEETCRKGGALEEYYNIIGYSDRNPVFKQIYDQYIEPSEMYSKSYDYVLITSTYYREIVNDLVDKFGIDCRKILVWEEEKRKREYFNKRGACFTFGQFGEDYVINSILTEKGINKKDASYIEVGVDNPFMANNTYFLHLSGADGILVDGNPEIINLIRTIRKNQVVLNKVISEKGTKQVPFYVSDTPSLSSLDIENIKLNNGKVKTKIWLEAISINDVLAMQENTIVLSIDLEGYDKVALKSINFDLYNPEIICAEVGKPDKKLVEYMEENGYIFSFCNYINSIWKRK